MTTWAQIIEGRAVNPVTVNPAECYAAEWLASQPPFVEVPDGTLHGAVDNGDGTFTNPTGPAVVKSWDAFDFKAKFTVEERIAIRTAAKSDASVEDFLDMLDTAGMTGTMIKANDPLLNAALDAMTPELLAEGRKAEILA